MVALESPNPSAIGVNVGGVMVQSLLTPSQLSRRSLLRGAALGAGVVTVPGLLAACSGGGGSSGGSGGAKQQNITFGSNYSDPTPMKALQAGGGGDTEKLGQNGKGKNPAHHD